MLVPVGQSSVDVSDSAVMSGFLSKSCCARFCEFRLLTDTQVDKGKAENPANQEEGEEDMSGTQFVCETVIRSLTLDAAPDHRPPQKKKSSLHREC